MSQGSCFCGKTGFKFTGDVQAKALCHCQDCQKISGSTYSTNFIVPEDGFTVTKGSLKTISKTADTGKKITSHFCPDCGSTLFRDGESFPGAKIIKAGVLDSPTALGEGPPAVELFAGGRTDWVAPLKGAGQKKGMPDSADM